MAHDDCPVRIAKDDLSTHIDQFVNEEQSALEHLLMEQHRATSLGSYDDQHRQQVWRQSRPRGISQRHDRTIDKRLYLVVSLFGDNEVVAFYLHLHTQAAEGFRDEAKVLDRSILDSDAFATHRCHADERSNLDHVRKYLVLSPMQLVDTLDGQQVRSDATDLCTHLVQQMTELLQIGFAGCVVDGCSALGKDGCHHDVRSTRHRGLVEQHIGALQALGGYLVDVTAWHMIECRTQFLETQKVGIEATTTYLIASWLGDHSLAHSCQ